MDKTLLLGNGLNRTLKDGFSWADMLKDLGSDGDGGDSVPFPIQFEEIAAQRGCMIGKRRSDPYKEIRTEISGRIDGLDLCAGEAHLAFRNIGMNHVVTTNCDTVFESMFDVRKSKENPGSSRNVLDAIFETPTVVFYHAHGLGSWKNTLCLGHEHYASLIGKIRSEFFTNVNDESQENITDLVTGKRESKHIWPELFFTSDIAIVGLGLDYSEIDLWWLLSMRAALFSPNKGLIENENRIIFYQIDCRNEK